MTRSAGSAGIGDSPECVDGPGARCEEALGAGDPRSHHPHVGDDWRPGPQSVDGGVDSAVVEAHRLRVLEVGTGVNHTFDDGPAAGAQIGEVDAPGHYPVTL